MAMAGAVEGKSNYVQQSSSSSTMYSEAVAVINAGEDIGNSLKNIKESLNNNPENQIKCPQIQHSVRHRHQQKERPIRPIRGNPLSPPPAKTCQYKTDARKLFGEPPYLSVEIMEEGELDRKLTKPETMFAQLAMVIRTSDEIKRGEDIKLPQFDPNFFSPKYIQCRFPHCPETKARSPTDHDSSQLNKEDLYLCQNHRQEMTNLITKQCAEVGIDVNYKDFKSEDFDDYTSLIGWMEKAFQQFAKKASQAFLPSRTDVFLAEIFLNFRNFLIITNILLNPDDENRRAVLPAMFATLESVLERLEDPRYVRNVLNLFRGLMQTILLPFGVTYCWVSLPFLGNPGAQIGAGIGGLLASTGAAVGFGGTSGLIALGAGIGFLCGGLLGGGIFNLREHNQNRHHLGNIGYRFIGAADGHFNMGIFHDMLPAIE